MKRCSLGLVLAGLFFANANASSSDEVKTEYTLQDFESNLFWQRPDEGK
jgi:hypothetical protein